MSCRFLCSNKNTRNEWVYMLIGLDVGGTNTDAALLDAASGRCLALAKAPTEPEKALPGMD